MLKTLETILMEVNLSAQKTSLACLLDNIIHKHANVINSLLMSNLN